jgi:AGZA family xanthine/uracil permease-like MFS transporter
MHGERIGIGQSPAVAASYLIVAAICVGCAKAATVTVLEPAVDLMEHGEAEAAQ